MTSEIDRIAAQLGKKQSAQIDIISNEIKETCDRFVKLNANLISSGEKLSPKNLDKLATIGEVLKDFRVKSAGIQEAWRLNQEQFEKRGLERDAYERKATELTKTITSIQFDFEKCALEVEAFEKQLIPQIQRTNAHSFQSSNETQKPKVQKNPFSILNKNKERNNEEETGASFSDPDAFIRIGLSYEQDKKPIQAKEYFQSVVAIRPNNATVWFHLGRANSDLGNHTEAIKCYQKVLDINPSHTGALCDLGFSLGQIGKHKQACKCFEKLVEADSNNANAWVGLGTAQYSMGKFKQAKESLEKARQIDPKNALAWYNLGLIYSNLGYQLESKRCYDEYEKLSSGQ